MGIHRQRMEVVWSDLVSDVFLFRPDDARSWIYFPALAERIQRFCKEVDSEMDPDALCATLAQYHAAGNPEVMAFGFLDDDNMLVGHGVTQVQDSYGTRAILVMQYSLDKAMPKEVRDRSMELLRTLAKTVGAEIIAAVVRKDSLERAWKRYHGAERYGVILRIPVDTPRGGQDNGTV